MTTTDYSAQRKTHPRGNSGAGNKTKAPPANKTVEAFAPGFETLFAIPAEDVSNIPTADVNRLVLCENFTQRGNCKMGARCKFVHATLAHAQRFAVHTNYAWRSLDEVTYERFSAGKLIEVAAPNEKSADAAIPSEYCLKTRCLSVVAANSRRPLSHCAHYYYNRCCNRGAECSFVHAVYLDANAKDKQRAPPPCKLSAQPQPPLQKARRASSAVAAPPVQQALPTAAAAHVVAAVPKKKAPADVRCMQLDHAVGDGFEEAVANNNTATAIHSLDGTPRATPKLAPSCPSDSSAYICGSPADSSEHSSSTPPTPAISGGNRYRYNPYSLVDSLVEC